MECNYLSRPAQVALLPGVGPSLRRLSELGFGLVVLTNQSAVGRGMLDLDQLQQIHRRMEARLAAEGVRLAGIYFCPHLPDDGCTCRKPAPGLLEAAARELDFDPRESFLVGDKPCDIELGRRVGATTFLVRTGHGAEDSADGVAADYVVADLPAAVAMIEQIWRRRSGKCPSAKQTMPLGSLPNSL